MSETEYNYEFANRLIDAAEALAGDDREESDRTIAYLSLLSCEISLKALLEEAGIDIDRLKRISHNLENLVQLVCECEFNPSEDIEYEPVNIRSVVVVRGADIGTIGGILASRLARTASMYPGEIRYGPEVKHFPPSALLVCAKKVSEWVATHRGKLVPR